MSDPVAEVLRAAADEARAIMRKRGLSLRQAGAEMGVDHSTLHRMVEGKMPSTETYLRVRLWLDAPPGDAP